MKRILAIFALVLVAIALIAVTVYAETTRERFKTRVVANYEKMEELAKQDGCIETKRYWTQASEGRGVVLWVECVATKQRYWLSTPDAHQKVRDVP